MKKPFYKTDTDSHDILDADFDYESLVDEKVKFKTEQRRFEIDFPFKDYLIGKNFVGKKLCRQNILSVSSCHVLKVWSPFTDEIFYQGMLKHILKLCFCRMFFFKTNDIMHTICHQLKWVYLKSYQFLNQFVQAYLFPPSYLAFLIIVIV